MIKKTLLSCFLLFSILSFSNGCTILPKFSEIIEKLPLVHEKPPQITSAKGLLSAENSTALMEQLKQSVKSTDVLQRYNTVLESVSGSPLSKGNKVTLLIDGQDTYDAMFKIIKNARDHINLETFAIEDDGVGHRFVDLLLQKQAEGVQVNLIYDSVGSFSTPDSFFQRLRDGGIQVLEYNPVNPLKPRGRLWVPLPDHRKVLIVDGKIVITGGVNISQVYSSSLSSGKQNKEVPMPWRDTDIQIEGPAVAEYQKLFIDTWLAQSGEKLLGRIYFPILKEEGNTLLGVVSSDAEKKSRIAFIMYMCAVTFAEHSVHLTTSYFVPNTQLVKALTDAAKCGVDVKIILPGTTDSSLILNAGRYRYYELLKAGVKLYRRRNALLHAKTAVIDGIWSTIGSTNLDFWSFLSTGEVNAVILSRDFAVEMEDMFAWDLSQSDQIQLEEWEKRPMLPRVKEWFSHLLAPWL